MFSVKAPFAAVVTSTELKQDVRGAFKLAEAHRVYVTKDGQPIGGLISMKMMAILDEVLSDRRLGKIAAKRLAAIQAGRDTLIDEKDFFVQAEARPSVARRIARTKR